MKKKYQRHMVMKRQRGHMLGGMFNTFSKDRRGNSEEASPISCLSSQFKSPLVDD